MLLVPHAFAGALIGIKINNPLISLPLAFLSHFVLDIVPHWNPSSKQWKQKNCLPFLATDLVLSIVISALIAYKYNSPLIFLNGLVAILPDLLQAPNVLFKNNFFLFTFLRNIQSKIQFHVKNIALGSITQILFVLICIFLLKEVSI